MNTILWIAQAVLAVLFLAHGLVYLMPPASMRPMIEQGPLPRRLLSGIGVAEILAAVALVVPGLTGVGTFLVPLAAAGLVLLMTGAVTFHASRRETSEAVVTLLLGVTAAFAVYGRWIAHPL